MAGYSTYYGGFTLLFLMVLVFSPFNTEVQGWGTSVNATSLSTSVALLFPYAYLFLVLGLAILLFVSMARKFS